MLTVYLSNKYIRIVTGESSSGKVNIRGMYYTIDTTGCLVNGSIVDEEALLDIPVSYTHLTLPTICSV